MKSSGNFVVVTTLATWFGLGSAPAFAQTTAPGPYYATPSWDQKITTGRFVVLANWNNEAVLDRETGLVWERQPSTELKTWINASFHCLNLNTGGRKGWRLPAVPELASLVDATQPFPMLPAGHPFTVQSPYQYWSATTVATIPGNAYFVLFVPTPISGVDHYDKNTDVLAWCVRGGTGGDAQ